MSRSPKTPPKAKLSAAKSSRSSSPRAARVSPPEPPPESGVRRAPEPESPEYTRRWRALLQGAEVAELATERKRLEPSDFDDLELLPLPQLLVFLCGGGNDENDLWLDLLTGIADDLERAHVAAINEENEGTRSVEWPRMLRPIRIRARAVCELRRREAVALQAKHWNSGRDFEDARALFDEGHFRLCEMLVKLDSGRVGDLGALRETYELARASVAMTPKGVDAQDLIDARGIAVEVGRRLDRLQAREHRHAEDVALLASVRGAA